MSAETKTQALPLLIVKPGTVSRRDIARAEKAAFILIVECSEPEQVRFVQPPIQADISDQARAAMELMRVLINDKDKNVAFEVGSLIKWWSRILLSQQAPREVNKVKP